MIHINTTNPINNYWQALIYLYPPDIKDQIGIILSEVGFINHVRGFHYLIDAILINLEHPQIVKESISQIYIIIAGINKTTPSRVERAIRHLTEYYWNNIDTNSYNFENIFSHTERPTNAELITRITNYLQIL